MSNDTNYKPHPLDVISHAHQKIDFIADAMACDDFEFSTSGQNGLYYLLREIAKELQESEIRLSEAGAIQAGAPCRTDT
jgi:hypothetical protein